MEKKIEKLEGSYDVPQLKQKLNEIIDHLNSQDQEGETRVRIYKDWQTLKGWVDEATKEEWEEEFMEVLETFKEEICSNFFASSKPLTDFIKQLLLEREREAEKNLLKRFYNATSKEEFRDVLDKLNKKK